MTPTAIRLTTFVTFVLLVGAVPAGIPTASAENPSHATLPELPVDDPIPDRENTSRAIINAAYGRGDIDSEQRILLLATSLCDPERLPEEYRGTAPEKCGTPVADEVERALPGLSGPVASRIRSMRSRPSCTNTYDTTHFRIHFDTSGPHAALDWPDPWYVHAVAAAAESSWVDIVDEMGFRAPPNDGSDPDGGGGNGLYDIYLQNLSGYYGVCYGSYTVPATPRTDCTSYVVIDNDYAGFGYVDPTDPMTVTVAHEFGHSCQNSHDYTEATWYKECTSVWVEDMVYDDIDDYRFYLTYYYSYPYESLEWQDGTGLRMYGSCVWNFFLAEHVSPDVVPSIWYELESAADIYVLMDVELSSRGTSLEEEFAEFALWNWFTGSRHDGTHYEESAIWPTVAAQRNYSSYPLSGVAPLAAHRPDHMAWNFIHFTNPGGGDDLIEISYDGPFLASTPNAAWLVTKDTGDATAEWGAISLNGWGNGTETVTGWDELSQVGLIVVNACTSTDAMGYWVDADLATPVEGAFFASATASDQVTLRWSIPNTAGMVGLDVERSRHEDGPFETLNALPLDVSSPGEYVDEDVLPGDELWYRLVARLDDGTDDVVGPTPAHVVLPGSSPLALSRPFPNPSASTTTLELVMPYEDRASVTVHDVSGRVVATVLDRTLRRGRHTVTWDGTDRNGHEVAAGVYFCSLATPDAVLTERILRIR
ncbi:MAG: T9SS type A sorting domain-containing protein [Candidatus Eisenbacteria bacterium]|nr:T9SS type A sorting domain-containing protein [Candidatus Eisenbacteria bacterium]